VNSLVSDNYSIESSKEYYRGMRSYNSDASMITLSGQTMPACALMSILLKEEVHSVHNKGFLPKINDLLYTVTL